MSRLLLLLSALTSFVSNTSFAVDCPSSDSVETTGASNGSSCTVSGSSSTIQLNFISGFTDSTGVSATGGNNGTTVGAQRKLSFIKAAEIVADEIGSAVVVVIDAQFASLSCTSNQATLGSAGATTNSGYGSPAPGGLRDNTFYPIGLMNAILGSDQNTSISDITAQFNSNIGNAGCLENSDGWYYGFDTPPSNSIGFVTVLLHEMTHGFGFASLVNKTFGTKASGLDDIYSVSLFDDVTGRSWMDPSQSDADRAASAISGNRLLWNGSNVNDNAIAYTNTGFADKDGSGTFTSGDLIQMYAPNPVEGGSSVSHFDTAVSPNELMEPQYTEGTLSLGLAKYLLQDIGWTVSSTSSVNTAPTITAVNQTTDEDVALTGVDASGWASDSDGDALTYSISSCPTNITCYINSDGTGLKLTPAAHYFAATNSVTMSVSDGQGGSASDSFNLTVNAVNDAPTWSTIPNQTLTEGNSVSIDLSPYTTDIENDALTYHVSACGAGLSCNLTSGSTLMIDANSNGGNTVAVTIEVTDGNGGADSSSFNITINPAPVINNPPVITAVDQVINEDNALSGVDARMWASDVDGDPLSFSISNCPSDISCSINSDGTNLILTPAADYFGSSNSVTISVEDGQGGSASDSFNLTVNAVNDAPTWSTIPNQTLTEGNSISIDLSSHTTDIENDALTYYVSTCGTGLDCNLTSGSTLMIDATSNGGNTVAVTIEVTDGNGGADSISFSITINTAPVINSNPVITAIDQTTDEDVVLTGVDASGWANDSDGDALTYSISSCPTNLTCEINSDGSGLKLTPAAHYFAATNSVTISVSDGQGGSASDSFNLTVNAVNDAPTWSAISDQLLQVGETIDIDLTANSSDVENDSLSYGISQCGSALSCVININILSITANNTSANAQLVEVSANDGNGATNTTSFSVDIESTPTLMVGGTQLNPNDTGYIDSNEIEVDISHLNSNHYFSISLNGTNHDAILETSANILKIGLPNSGQFAGTYILSATDKNSGDEHLFYLVRDPSIVLSASSVLSDTSDQTLTIVGAAPDTVYSLVSSEQALSFTDSSGNNVTNVTIQNDSNTNHATSVILKVDSLLSETVATLQVDIDLEASITLVPSRRHQIQVQDENYDSLSQARIELNTTGLSNFNLAAEYVSDDNGVITLLLPADDTPYSATVMADGYSSENVTLAPELLQQTVRLGLDGEVITVRGNIEATGGLTFVNTLPTLTLLLSNGLEIAVPVSQTSTTSASFDYEFNDSIGTISKLRFEHPDAQALTVDFVSNSEYLIFMESQSPLAGAITVIGASGGGSLGWILLILLTLLLKPSIHRKR